MRKAVMIPLCVGLILLVVGIAQSYPSLANITIHSSGTIRNPYNNESNLEVAQQQHASSTTQLDIIGFLTIIASLGFFTVAYLNNRNLYSKKKTAVT